MVRTKVMDRGFHKEQGKRKSRIHKESASRRNKRWHSQRRGIFQWQKLRGKERKGEGGGRRDEVESQNNVSECECVCV